MASSNGLPVTKKRVAAGCTGAKRWSLYQADGEWTGDLVSWSPDSWEFQPADSAAEIIEGSSEVEVLLRAALAN
jgi:hypothetical protein